MLILELDHLNEIPQFIKIKIQSNEYFQFHFCFKMRVHCTKNQKTNRKFVRLLKKYNS